MLQQPGIGAVEEMSSLLKGARGPYLPTQRPMLLNFLHCLSGGFSKHLQSEKFSNSHFPVPPRPSEYAEGAENEVFREKIGQLEKSFTAMRR